VLPSLAVRISALMQRRASTGIVTINHDVGVPVMGIPQGLAGCARATTLVLPVSSTREKTWRATAAMIRRSSAS
jgi:hypothetical protein